jgi:hypothetical protein
MAILDPITGNLVAIDASIRPRRAAFYLNATSVHTK